ncbi:MAG: hypothetical protein R3202_07590 [Candidatus Competibacterales bacterium]|nr:hypothetical protein [Candidatus Competibacterales bacterium]
MLALLIATMAMWGAPMDELCPESPRRLTHAAENYSPQWSPDGQWIVFESTLDHALDIHLMRANGSERRQLTDSGYRDVGPFWHPDGTRVAFFSERDDPDGPGGGWRAFYVDLERDRIERLVKGKKYAVFRPVYSPDGQTVAFDGWSQDHPWHEIFLYDIDRRRSHQRLTAHEGHTAGARFSPDGQSLAYFRMAEDRLSSEIFIMDLAGGTERQVTWLGHSSQYPAWAPDGRQLLFESHLDGNWEILKLDLGSGKVVNLTNHGEKDTNPAWHPKQPWLLFVSERDGLPQLFCQRIGAGTPVVNEPPPEPEPDSEPGTRS